MSQKQCSMWSWFLVHLCKMMVAGGVFVIFSKFWFFELLFGVKGQKMAKNDEKCYLTHWSQEPYIIIVIYGAPVWNDKISRCFFFFFHFYKSLIFWIFRGKREKMNQTDKKLCLLYLILRDHTSYDLHLWYTCVKW